MIKSIFVWHTAHFLSIDPKHISAHVWQNLECPRGIKMILALSTLQQMSHSHRLSVFELGCSALSDKLGAEPCKILINIVIIRILVVIYVSNSALSLLYTCRPPRLSLRHFSPLPAVSLHALSILALLTCRFHYQPFPYRVVYTLFPLPAHSRPP